MSAAMTRANRLARQERERRWRTVESEVCGVCGLLRINVAHNIEATDQIEGPDYYASIADSLHAFVSTGRFQWGYREPERDREGRLCVGRR